MTAGGGDLTPVWSPDSKWLAYAQRLKNHMGAVYPLLDSRINHAGDRRHERLPLSGFDKDGKYLYFTASTDGPVALAGYTQLRRPVTEAFM